MKREDLTKLGLTDDATIDAIMAAHGKDIEKFKTAAETAQAEATGLKTQLTEAGAAIEGFKKLDIEGVKKSADEWKAKAETTAVEAQKQLASLKFEQALDGSLASAKAKNPRAVKALLDPAALKYNETDGSIVGLKEQLENTSLLTGKRFPHDLLILVHG